MSLKDVDFKSSYTSLNDDIVQEFYIPVMNNAFRFDRMTCYFSPKALSNYSVGLYYLGKKNLGKYRLLISREVSRETFEIIRSGYYASLLIDENIRESLRDNLTLDDHNNLSNLAFLIECGIVEVKFAFCLNGGLFHIKSGYVEDADGNSLCFKGSNNETAESVNRNYESFDVTTSWLSSLHDTKRIHGEKLRFEELWSGGTEQVVVVNPSKTFIEYISSFNKGNLIDPAGITSSDKFILDFVDTVILKTPETYERTSKIKFRLGMQSYVNRIEGHMLYFKKNMTRNDAKRLNTNLTSYCELKGYYCEMTAAFREYIESFEPLEHLAKIGSSIKIRDDAHGDAFQIFKNVVDSICIRPLTEEQMWDSYLLYNLKNGANFSVPGSGKTATVLGLFGFLYKSEMAKRIIMIGPLNSFDTWEYEFKAVFGDNIPLASMNASALREENKPLDYNVRFNSGNANLILLNYESFDYGDSLADAVSERIGDDALLVFDEVHRIKNPTGKRASKLVPLGKISKYTVVMTGTPIPNSYADVYNFLNILYPHDYDDYFKYGPSALSDLDGSDIELMNRKMSPFFCRTTKKKLGVPDANDDNIISVNATHEENALLDTLRRTVTNPLALIIRILQLESDPQMLSSHLSDMELSSFIDDEDSIDIGGLDTKESFLTSKTTACIDLVERLVSEDKKVVVWCIFVRSIENIQAFLGARGISAQIVCGGTPDRLSILDSFRDGPVQVLITNPQTLAEAVSLHKTCHDAVYFEYSYNLVHLLQSKDRIHRFGLAPGQYTQYHFLQTEFFMDDAPMSLDGEILTRLNNKERIMLDAIENDSIEHFTTTREEVEEMVLKLGLLEKIDGAD